MPEMKAELLESWDRQCRILDNLASIVDESLIDAKPDPGGWPIAYHLCHIHHVRRGWLKSIEEASLEPIGRLIENDDSEMGAWTRDVATIRAELAKSAAAVRQLVAKHLDADSARVGPYTHVIEFLQHMVWHEGWHVGLIFLAMRLAGKEPDEKWEEHNVWGIWRDEEDW